MHKDSIIRSYLGKEINDEFLEAFPNLSKDQRSRFEDYKLKNKGNMKSFFVITYSLGKKWSKSTPETNDEDTFEEILSKYKEVRFLISNADDSNNFKETALFDSKVEDLNSFKDTSEMIKEFNTRKKAYMRDVLSIISQENANKYPDYLTLNDGINETSKNYVDHFKNLGLFSHDGNYEDLSDAGISLSKVDDLKGLWPKSKEEKKEKLLFLSSKIKDEYLKKIDGIVSDYCSEYPEKKEEIQLALKRVSNEDVLWEDSPVAQCHSSNKFIKLSDQLPVLTGFHEYVHYFQHILKEILPMLEHLKDKDSKKYIAYFETGILSEICSYFPNNGAMPNEVQAGKTTNKFFIETVKEAVFRQDKEKENYKSALQVLEDLSVSKLDNEPQSEL